MLLTNSNLLNSCRVCRSPNQDGDHVCLYKNFGKTEHTQPELSEAGALYENLLNVRINWYKNILDIFIGYYFRFL